MRHLDPSTACAIVLEARAVHAKVEVVDPASGSNPADDGALDVLQDYPGDPVGADLRRRFVQRRRQSAPGHRDRAHRAASNFTRGSTQT
jgi:hypothetical protein